jgi:metal-dependent amidase/aminoacylase/carboxypeptidase family protein
LRYVPFATSSYIEAGNIRCGQQLSRSGKNERNVTVTLEEDVARWARLEAARKETSVSRLLSEILKERMLEKDGYEGAMPDEVKLALTVRSYKPEVRKQLLASIARIVKGEAMAGGSPQEPLIKVTPAANALYNDPELTKREVGALKKALSDAKVVEIPPKMVFEDFSAYSLAGVPAAMFYVGEVEPGKFAAAQQSGAKLPGLHSPLWAPDREPTIKTAIMAETAMLMELMGK